MEELNLMNKQQAAGFLTPKSKAPEWLDVVALRALKVAVESKSKTVILHGGKFNIKYGYSHTYPASNETRELILLTPERGFVPMGYVDVAKIRATPDA